MTELKSDANCKPQMSVGFGISYLLRYETARTLVCFDTIRICEHQAHGPRYCCSTYETAVGLGVGTNVSIIQDNAYKQEC